MQVRALLLAFALFGAGCRSVSEPAAALVAPPLAPIPQFIARLAWELWPEKPGANGFISLWHVGDLDGDGFEDVAAEACYHGLLMNSRDWLVSGRDGVPKAKILDASRADEPRRRRAEGWSASVAAVVPVGDVNGDGVPDIAMGVCGDDPFAGDPPTGVWLFSSDSWEVLKVWRRNVDTFGRWVAPVGDVDGDGRSDFAVSNDFDPPSVEVLSVAFDTSTWMSELPVHRGSILELIAIGDVDGDGLDELAVQVRSSIVDSCTLFVLGGRDGSIRWSRSGAHPREWSWLSIASAGDADGDRVPDIWVVIHESGPDCTSVELLSGRDGATLQSAERPRSTTDGIKPCADLDGDGVSELVVPWWLEGEESEGAIEVISSRTLTSLCYFPCEEGLSVAALRTPHGLRIVTNGDSGLQAFDLVRVEAGR